MDHWLSSVVILFQSDTADLRQLAAIAGGNPATFYKGVRIKQLDFRGQDLRGMEFSPYTASHALVDEHTLLDPSTAKHVNKRRTVTLTKPVNALPTSSEALHVHVQHLIEKKHFHHALEALEYAIRLFPDDLSFRTRLAFVYETLGDNTAAIAILYKILQTWPKDSKARVRLLYLLDRTGRKSEVLDLVSSTGQSKFTDLPFARMVSKILGRDEIALAIDWFELSVLQYQDPELWILLAELYVKNRQLDKAAEAYRHVLAGPPLGLNAFRRLASDLRLDPVRSVLRNIFFELQKKQPFDLAMTVTVVRALISVEEYQLAEHFLKTVIALAPGELAFVKWLGELYLKANRLHDAVNIYARLVDEFPDNISAYRWLGKALVMNDDPTTAAAVYSRAFEKAGRAVSWKWFAELLHQPRTDILELANIIYSLLSRFPGDAGGSIVLSAALERLGNPERATIVLEQSVLKGPLDARLSRWQEKLLDKVLQHLKSPKLDGLIKQSFSSTQTS